VDVPIRLFTEADIPFGMRLKRIAGWNQTPDDWRRFLTLGRGGCFVAEAGGQPVGTATTTPYGDRFGWVGMVLVLPEHRRQGIGTALLEHAIRSLEDRGVACVRLDATPLGKKVYDTIAFRDEYGLKRMEGTADALGDRGKPMTEDDLPGVAAFDAARFGADRTAMLELLWRQAPDSCLVARNRAGDLEGYLMARSGENAFQIGPWVAVRPETAEELFRCGLSALAGERIFLDVPLVRPEPAAIAERYGFTTQRPFIRMYRGDLRYPGRPEDTYAICGVETG
jgi:ribosomal protein S18 acetylase RimI-like enzyme